MSNYQMFAGAISPAYLPLVNYGTVGTSDDSATWAAALNAASNVWSTSRVAPVILVPPGVTTIGTGNLLPSLSAVPYAIRGYGMNQSMVQLSASFTGNLFRWSECWQMGNHNSSSSYNAGASVSDISLFGAGVSAAGTQNAIMLYDRNDGVLIENVLIMNFNGRGIASGKPSGALPSNQAYMRESTFNNVQVFNCGSSSVAAVDFDTNGTSATQDASNTNHISGLRVFGSGGTGVMIQNNSTNGNLRYISFDDLFIEGLQSGSSGDCLQIYNASTNGALFSIQVKRGGFINAGSGYSGVNILAAAGSPQMYGFDFEVYTTNAISTNMNGIQILNGRNLSFKAAEFIGSGGTGYGIVIGPTSGGVGGALMFDTANSAPTISIDASSVGHAYFTQYSNFTSTAGANTATLTNAPVAGNPTKWVPVYDPISNTTRYSPLW